MSSNVYTLPEMVDLALMTPEKGAVNFNVLRILIHKILSACKLQSVTAEWKPLHTPISKALYKEELPVHPVFRELKTDVKEERRIKSTGTSLTAVGFISKPSEGKDSSEGTPVDPVTETVSDSEITVSGRKKKHKKAKHKKTIIIQDAKGLKAGVDLWSAWQFKKMEKKIEALEEEINSIVNSVDEIQEWVENRKKRTLLEEGQKFQSEYTGHVGRTEFEDTIEEIGEALTHLSMKQIQQSENNQAQLQNVFNELSLKVSFEEHNRSKDELNKEIKTVSVVLRNMQKLIKNVVYPESCGVTKCMACNRKSHLPLRSMVKERRKKVLERKTDKDDVSSESTQSTETESPHDLRFTPALLAKARTKGDFKSPERDKSSKSVTLDQKQMHQERSFFPEYLVKLKEFDSLAFSLEEFAPLRIFPTVMRPDEIYAPSHTVLHRKNQVAVSAGGKESNISLRRCIRR